jgi:iron(III) transport system ATP-binding protein
MNLVALQCSNLTKKFDGLSAVQNLNLDVFSGEVLAILGPSGCGKTTFLRLLAGFDEPDEGRISIYDEVVSGDGKFVPPEKRSVGFVFQEHALFPHLNVIENVSFGLQKSLSSNRVRARELLELVGLNDFERRFPHELSGGERQRVALARALAPQPMLILFDEPFSNLDADRRSQIRRDVRNVIKEINTTAIFVTHDQEEAFAIGDRLVIMQQGKIEQVAYPEEVFMNPASRFVAEFLGKTDFLPGIITATDINTEVGSIQQSTGLPEGEQVEIAIRADDLSIYADLNGNGVVLERIFKGAYQVYRIVLTSGNELNVMCPHTQMLKEGEKVQVTIDPGHPLAVFYQGSPI